ncbi:YidH family protein, partial [Streptosporangium vulgare]|uniref:YidH family protein n=1 Tax=Streptosporangium vulgare TaxID=46190 RepID=UPI0031DADDC4
ANERTYLTWLSTSLALSAGGVAMAAVSADVFVPWMRTLLAVVLVSLSALAAAMAYPRWRRVQRALRSSAPLPPPRPRAPVRVRRGDGRRARPDPHPAVAVSFR